jgi:hypothetical protein
MQCTRCAAATEDRHGELTCTASGSPVSRHARAQLEAIVERTAEAVERRPDQVATWGVRWFCPAEAKPLREVDGLMECNACGRVLRGSIVDELIELDPQLTIPWSIVPSVSYTGTDGTMDESATQVPAPATRDRCDAECAHRTWNVARARHAPDADQMPGVNVPPVGNGSAPPFSIASHSISAMSWTLTASSLPSPFTPSSIIT